MRVQVPCIVEERVSSKTGNSYVVIVVPLEDDKTMLLFPNNDQQTILHMTYLSSKKIKMASKEDN